MHLHNYPTFRREQLTGMASTIGFLKDEANLGSCVSGAEVLKGYIKVL